MKTWFKKFRISATLDSHPGRPKSFSREFLHAVEPVRSSPRLSVELCQFKQETQDLHERLQRTPPPRRLPPPGLHASIMRAVRDSAPSTVASSATFSWSRFALPAFGLVLVLFAGWWMLTDRSRFSQRAPAVVMPSANAALDLGQQLTQAAPLTVMAPLADEWDRLSRDLDSTAEFVRAAIPAFQGAP